MYVSATPDFYMLILGLSYTSQSSLSFQRNTGQFNSSFAGADHRIQRAWIQGLTGCGVTVAVVDDGNTKVVYSAKCNIVIQLHNYILGVEYTHPDLSPNYVSPRFL